MIDQTITTPPTPPSSNDIPTFRTRFDAFIIWICTFVSQMTTLISQINSTATTIIDKEASTVSASIIASASANFKGVWTSLSNVQANESYVFNGIFYRALQNSVGQTPPDSSVNYQNSYWVGYGVTLSLFNQKVSNTGDEQILGIKTFSSSPIVPTLAVGDNSTKVASTAFVKGSLGNFRSQTVISANTTLSNSYIGVNTIITTPGITITFPSTGAISVGSVFLLDNPTSGSVTLNFNGNSTEFNGTTLAAGEVAMFISDGNSYYRCPLRQIAGRPSIADIGNNLASNGYLKLSNGLIMQWGSVANVVANTVVAVTFPISFTTAAYSVVATVEGDQITNSNGDIGAIKTNTVTTSSFNLVYSDDVNSTNIKWFAIGK